MPAGFELGIFYVGDKRTTIWSNFPATRVVPLFDHKNDISKNQKSSHFKLFVPVIELNI